MPQGVEADSPRGSGDDGVSQDVEADSPGEWDANSPRESGDDGVPKGVKADSSRESGDDGVHKGVKADSPRESDLLRLTVRERVIKMESSKV